MKEEWKHLSCKSYFTISPMNFVEFTYKKMACDDHVNIGEMPENTVLRELHTNTDPGSS